MSAPATNVRPVPVIKMAATAPSSARRASTAARAVRTPRSRALTGGLSIATMATPSRRETLTSSGTLTSAVHPRVVAPVGTKGRPEQDRGEERRAPDRERERPADHPPVSKHVVVEQARERGAQDQAEEVEREHLHRAQLAAHLIGQDQLQRGIAAADGHGEEQEG